MDWNNDTRQLVPRKYKGEHRRLQPNKKGRRKQGENKQYFIKTVEGGEQSEGGNLRTLVEHLCRNQKRRATNRRKKAQINER